MSLVGRLKSWLASRKPKPVNEWFSVEFDDQRVVLHAAPPGKQPWEDSFPWSCVTRVCFKDEGPWLSDGIYVFTSLRPESFVVPTEARGSNEFFQSLVARGLFPREIAAQAITSSDGAFYCWPAEDSNEPGA